MKANGEGREKVAHSARSHHHAAHSPLRGGVVLCLAPFADEREKTSCWDECSTHESCMGLCVPWLVAIALGVQNCPVIARPHNDSEGINDM